VADVTAYDPVFEAAGNEWNVDPQLLKAIATQESGGRTAAVSPKGAQGLMQIMPDTQKYLGMTDPNDPVQSIYGAAKYLSEGLDKEGTPQGALLFYHGGPDWRQNYGPESAAYVPAVTKHYQRLGQVKTALAAPDPSTATDATPSGASAPAVSTGAGKTMASSDPLSLLPPAPKPTAGGPATASPDDPLSLLPPAPKPTGTTATVQAAQPGGLVKNIAAGELEGVGGTINALTNPSGNLIGKPLATAIVFAHDALAPVFGYERFPDDVRNALLNDTVPQPGTRAIEAIGGVVGAKPSDVQATTPTEQYGRTAASGATMGALMGPGVIGPIVGASGAVTGKAAGEAAPPWAAPAAELAGNVLGGAAAVPVVAGVRAGTNALSGGVSRFVDAPGVPEPNRAPAAGGPVAEGAPRPAAPESDGVGGAAGAQVTPSYEAIHTPAEEAAYRANAEGKKLIEGQKIGEPDLNQYIPGETANNAEREQTAKAARELKELGIRVPEASQLDKEAAESNNTARVIYAENTAKGPVEIANRRTQRETDIKADKARVFAPDNVTGPVDFAPVIKQMEAALKEPENRQNSALQSVYREQLERIKTANIEDPAEAWGLRRDLDRLTDKRMAAKDPNLHYVAHHLDDVANLIDTQNKQVAPGYSDMLAKYKEHSRAISEMEVLQGALKNLRGPGQKMTYNDFQRFMKNVVDSRMTPSTDLNAFKTISEENMQRLWNIRDSLRRTASAKELASAAGSDTMPNIIDALKGIGKMGGTAALHAYVGAHLGPGGNLALQSLGALGKSLNDRRTIRRATEQMNRLLRPSEPLRVPPGQENPLTGAPPP
jgi:hypothetical protein